MQGVATALFVVCPSSRPPPRRATTCSGAITCSNGVSSGVSLLQGASQLAIRGVGGCQHPVRPKPLRTLATSPTDLLVELVVADRMGHPSCLLPTACPLSEEVRELLGLGRLTPSSLLPTLAALAAYLEAEATPEEAAALRGWPGFIALLERALELACERRMGPAAPLALLRLLSLLRFDDAEGAALRDGYAHFYRLLADSLEAAAKREPLGLTPAAVLGAYEAWACIDLEGAAPLKATAFAGRVREVIQGNAFSVEESARFFCAVAALLRRGGGRCNPSSYDVNVLVARLCGSLGQLGGLQLEGLAWACGAFSWPLYQAPVQLLDALAREAMTRMAEQTIHRSLGNAVLSTATRAAHSLRPRLGTELRARIADLAAEAEHRAAPGTKAASAAVAAAPGRACECPGVWDCVDGCYASWCQSAAEGSSSGSLVTA